MVSQRPEIDYPGIGRLFCAPLRWRDFAGIGEIRAYLERLVEHGAGGIILYGGDSEGTPQVLGEIRRRSEYPIFVMADMETGTAQQIPGGTAYPSLMALGATRSADLAYRVGRATALEALALGVNVVLAPVLDVNTNPLNPIVDVRSFGESPELVAELGAAYIRGCQEAGVIACAKHFPGHGDTDIDSHIGLPVIGRGPGSLRALEIPPFKRAIAEGVKAVMVGHISLPALTGSEDIPASLSHEVVTGLLRRELGFDELILTDAMNMGGVGEAAGRVESVVRALRAGNDLLLYVEDIPGTVAGVEAALRSGSLDHTVIERAIERVSRARRHLSESPPTEPPETAVIGCREHQELARTVADRSATLVRNRGDFFPLSPEDRGLFVILDEEGADRSMDMTAHLASTFPGWHLIAPGGDRSGVDGATIERVKAAEKTVVFAFSRVRAWRGTADLTPEGVATLTPLLEAVRRAALVSLGSPYLMRHFPWIDACLCLYGPARVSQESVVRVLSGGLNPSGRLPVSIPGLYPAGWGISFRGNGG